jgi:hypothetical protein
MKAKTRLNGLVSDIVVLRDGVVKGGMSEMALKMAKWCRRKRSFILLKDNGFYYVNVEDRVIGELNEDLSKAKRRLWNLKS